MIIAIAILNNELNSTVHMQFGRCAWFAIYNTSSNELMYLKNPEQDTVKDAGLKVASLLVSKGVSKVVAGRFGVKTADYLRGQQVQMIIPRNEEMTLGHLVENITPVSASL